MMILRAAALAAAVAASAGAAGGAGQSPRVAVLVELFTSEGCSSCPPADAFLERLHRAPSIGDVDVIAVGFHVDYFNHLGWKDGFSSAAFTRRQQEYSAVFGADSVYTPQIVVDGQEAVVGSDDEAVRRAIANSARHPHVDVRVTARATADRAQLAIDLPAAPDTSEPVSVLAAITEDGLTTAVTRGENQGRTLRHAAVARSVRRVATLVGTAAHATVDLDLKRSWEPAALRAVVWLQGDRSRRVYGTASTRVTR